MWKTLKSHQFSNLSYLFMCNVASSHILKADQRDLFYVSNIGHKVDPNHIFPAFRSLVLVKTHTRKIEKKSPAYWSLSSRFASQNTASIGKQSQAEHQPFPLPNHSFLSYFFNRLRFVARCVVQLSVFHLSSNHVLRQESASCNIFQL